LDRGARPDIIDVRHWDEYVKLHIKGARSMPIRAVAERAPLPDPAPAGDPAGRGLGEQIHHRRLGLDDGAILAGF
ncbi:MAG: rhodanese-like domain-containing protein, partial [Chloroflexi bacterium]|nr:rhodanese-like domain-containing protein [Chloroflexota bacterium]